MPHLTLQDLYVISKSFCFGSVYIVYIPLNFLMSSLEKNFWFADTKPWILSVGR